MENIKQNFIIQFDINGTQNINRDNDPNYIALTTKKALTQWKAKNIQVVDFMSRAIYYIDDAEDLENFLQDFDDIYDIDIKKD